MSIITEWSDTSPTPRSNKWNEICRELQSNPTKWGRIDLPYYEIMEMINEHLQGSPDYRMYRYWDYMWEIDEEDNVWMRAL